MAKKRVVDPMIVGRERRRGASVQARHITVEDNFGSLKRNTAARSSARRDLDSFASDREVLDRAFGVDKYDDRGVSRVEKRKAKTNKKAKPEKKRKKKGILGKIVLVLVLLFVGAIVAAGYYGWTLLDKTSTVFQGSALDILKMDKLKQDKNGRTNVLVFGTSEDDKDHNGALLTDSIVVISADQEAKNAYQFSIPRDLWVSYGLACIVGFQGKVNATYMCALNEYNNNTDKAAKYFAKVLGKMLDLDIQYYVAVDYTVVKDVVNALDGIDVDIYSDDSRGIYDYQTGLQLKAGVNHLNGKQALLLARARNSHGGYGLSRSNFDREINQQRIIQAIQKKALSTGVLADPGKVTSMLDALGDNVKTNVSMSELRTVLDVAQGLDGGVKSVDLTKQFTTGMVGKSSVVMTVDGVGNYGTLQKYLKKKLVTKSSSNTGNSGN